MSIFPDSVKRVLVTGGAGFIGSNLISKLLNESNLRVYNLDKLGYSSFSNSFNRYKHSDKYKFFNIDLYNNTETLKVIKLVDPDLVFHLAAESHVDKSIAEPRYFLNSNVIGTFNLLQALLLHWQELPESRKSYFRILHVSTDEVFGSANKDYFFNEETKYDPRSPYSATKAASDHLVRSWHNTYGLPAIITNSSNNFGPWQFPEKLIPVIIKNALSCNTIPIYGDGTNVRDWIFVDDHVDALIQVIIKGKVGESYCIGSKQVKTNQEILKSVCDVLDIYNSVNSPHIRFKEYVEDRLGHDKRYAIDNKKIINELNWYPRYDFNQAINLTVKWYLDNKDWLNQTL